MNTTPTFAAPEAALLKDYGIAGQSVSPQLAARIKQDAATHYVWIAKASLDELRAARPLAVLGASGNSMVRLCGGRGSIRALYGDLTPMDNAKWPHQAHQWKRALARLDARLAGTTAAVTTPARLTSPAPKAAVAPITQKTAPAPSASPKPAAPLFGLARVEAALRAEMAAAKKRK